MSNHNNQIDTDIPDSAWALALEQSGERIKNGVEEGTTLREKCIARSYTLNGASRRLNVRKNTLTRAIEEDILPAFIDPEATVRIAVEEIEKVLASPEGVERIADFHRIPVRDVALVAQIDAGEMRQLLADQQLNRSKPMWKHLRGEWNLPETLEEFYEVLQTRRDDKRTNRRKRRNEKKQRARERRDAERKRRDELRQQLLDAFPVWDESDRTHQNMLLHIGPPNSGKTHDALNRLAEGGAGWYLAPLRLLAFEVFDRLNQRGILCNLLTGEESIPIPGATITAATIEMFNPVNSGECVIIDEAQMLADPDRGWAWTRAMMECQAPEMHVIAPPTAQTLIERLAEAADIPIGVVEHKRLTPIGIADRQWSIKKMPERTILVAFSRRKVLELKAQLENENRTVSVVYGSLPPEVRRKQADRFASGETEICIATDAVGMGLNLPADHVCFHESSKYDGRTVRRLTPTEVHQIGGRAGRYGISEGGLIGATTRKDLQIIRALHRKEPEILTHAHVAPTVEDLAMIPGSLAEKLKEWALLESIPEEIRHLVTTADLTERVNLANMLTDEEVETLGLDRAVQLTNSPTRRSSRDYWYACAQSIIAGQTMPIPDIPPTEIHTESDLEYTETCIAKADVYLWAG